MPNCVDSPLAPRRQGSRSHVSDGRRCRSPELTLCGGARRRTPWSPPPLVSRRAPRRLRRPARRRRPARESRTGCASAGARAARRSGGRRVVHDEVEGRSGEEDRSKRRPQVHLFDGGVMDGDVEALNVEPVGPQRQQGIAISAAEFERRLPPDQRRSSGHPSFVVVRRRSSSSERTTSSHRRRWVSPRCVSIARAWAPSSSRRRKSSSSRIRQTAVPNSSRS